MPNSFEHIIKVKPEHIDAMEHVNNIVYIQWVQEIAAAHWQTKATEQQKKEVLWVVLRHEIDYLKPALEGDTIIGTTWVEPAKGAKTVRHVEIRRKGDNLLFSKARTTWVAINAKTGRPMRLDEGVMRVFY